MKLSGARPLLISVVLHASVLGALAFWKLPARPVAALPETTNGGSGAESAGETTIHLVRPEPKTIKQPVAKPAVSQRRLFAAKPSEVVLRIPDLRPEPEVAPPTTPVQPATLASAKQEAKSLPGTGGGRKASGKGLAAGRGSGNAVGNRAASYRHQADLAYPASAKRQMQKGVVRVRVFVNSRGLPEQVEITASSGFDALDKAAVSCAKASTYLPALREGEPISSWVDASYRFQ